MNSPAAFSRTSSNSIPSPRANTTALGHYHRAAAFDKKSENSKGELRATATGHFFRMNMRTHHMSCLGMANPEDGKKKAHGHHPHQTQHGRSRHETSQGMRLLKLFY